MIHLQRKPVMISVLSLAALVGLSWFLLTMPWKSVFAGADGFSTFEDQLLTTASLRYFVWDAWRWPVTLAHGLGDGPGTPIALTDSIPLYGLILRLFRPLITPQFNFIGVWLATCYVLQSLSGALALRAAGVTDRWHLLGAASLTLTIPAWIARAAHTALSSHFLIVLGVGLYFFSCRPRNPLLAIILGLALAWITSLVNPYLFVIVSGFVGAAFLRQYALGVVSIRTTGGALVLLIVGAGLVMLCAGYFGDKGPGVGFSIYSMNLLSPISPNAGPLVGVLPRAVDATGGQYEGFNYLGLGALFLLGVTLAVAWKDIPAILKRHWIVALFAIGLAAISLSNQVYLGKLLVLDLPKPPQAIAMFRCPGRFFWGTVYFALLGALVLLGRRIPRRASTVVLLISVAFQVWDTTSDRAAVHRVMNRSAIDHRLDVFWNTILPMHDKVEIVPDYSCLSSVDQRLAATTIAYRASRTRIPINTVYLPRPLKESCGHLAERALGRRDLKAGRLLVLLHGEDDATDKYAVLRLGVAGIREHCRTVAPFTICSSTLDWNRLDDHLPVQPPSIAVPFPPVNVDREMRFHEGSADLKALVAGWSIPNERGVWTDGRKGTVALVPGKDAIDRPCILVVHGAILLFPGDSGERVLRVTVDGRLVSRVRLAPRLAAVSAMVPLDLRERQAGEPLSIVFEINRAPTADQALKNGDPRVLGFRLDTLCFAQTGDRSSNEPPNCRGPAPSDG